MEVLRHDDVAGHNEIVFAPDFFKTLEEEISSSRRFQELSAAIATVCNEMKFAATVESLASFRHAEQYSARVNHSHLRSTKEVPRRMGHPRHGTTNSLRTKAGPPVLNRPRYSLRRSRLEAVEIAA